MASNDPSILVADPDPAVGRWWVERLATLGAAAHAMQTPAQVLLGLATGKVELLLTTGDHAPADLQALLQAAHKQAVAPLLAVASATTATLERALQLGCRGLLARDADDTALRAALAAADRQRRLHAAQVQDQRRLRFQYDELRRHCAAQAERHQDAQETYFLDLSRMMTIIANIMDGIVFTDRDGNVTLLNPVAEDLLGSRSFVAIGKPIAQLTGRRELLGALAHDHANLGDRQEVSQTVEVHHAEQDLLYIKCITSRVLDYRGKVAGVLSVLKDVTAEFKQDQLKNQYLSIVAHELRTPLTAIKTFSTMMGKGTLGQLNGRQTTVVDSIREQSLRLEHQIDKLINLGHLESDDYGQDREAFTLAEFAHGLVAPFEQPARDRGIALEFTCVDDDVQLWADRADLRRACQALIENAVKFTRDGGHVRVAVGRAADGTLRFSVRDDGIGVDPRYHRRIFEKFFQVEDPLTRHHGGAGLGLFVAAGIVAAHGSRIEVSSQLGQGADFSFALPVQREGEAAPATAVPQTSTSEST